MKRIIIASAWVCTLLLSGCGGMQSQSSPTALEQMQLAERSRKVSVPVDVRYRVRGVATRDQPVELELAFVARVSGQNLRVEFPQPQALTIDTGGAAFSQQKAEPKGVVRRSLIVTPHSERGAVRVLVSLDVDGGRSFGVFSIPIRSDR